MKTAIALVKNIILPKLDKDSKFSEEKVDSAFWEKFTTNLLLFEEDAKPIYASIYSLELDNPEKVIDKLPHIYAQFLNELAENYVLGEPSQATDYLLKTNNATFAKEIDFLKTMQQAIKSVERKRIKSELPTSYQRLSFELSETDLANATKKKGREDLKEKMIQWNLEMQEEEEKVSVISMLETENLSKKESGVILISLISYASIAAIFIIGFLIWQPNKLSNDVLFDQYATDETVISNIDYQKIESVAGESSTRGGEVLFQNLTKLETDKAMEALELFKRNNFERSKQLLLELNVKEKNTQLLMFLATTQLKTNEVSNAVFNLEYLNTLSGYEFANDVKFYLALGYLKQNEKKKAKGLLKAIVSSNGKYAKGSQEILDKIRWF